MSLKDKIVGIQKELLQQEVDGWLLYDFRRTNDLACEFLEIAQDQLLTRRFFYWIPKKGEPVKIVHVIESHALDHLPGKKVLYRSWQELEREVAFVLQGSSRIAMEYSPRNAIPYVSKVDAGTLEVIRGFQVEVVSSADLLQKHSSVWDADQLKMHLKAADVLDKTAAKAWAFIQDHLKKGKPISEYDVQQFILQEFRRLDCMTEGDPICAVNEQSANPHYMPTAAQAKIIRKGDFILIDLWCKQNLPRAVYADITRVGVAAAQPSARQQEIFSIVKQARDSATALVKEQFEKGQPLKGCEVDQHCRDIIGKAGFGEFFIHRTGHNIGVCDHGSGAHLDNLETHDQRYLLQGTCFSIEPGIYLPGEFGVRLEYDLFVHLTGQVQITGGIQNEIVCLF